MPATIQKILKPTKYRAVDTSGNNNHGQIYSGRALEFDGVTDYLLGPTITTGADFMSVAKDFTVAFWINADTLQESVLWSIKQSNSDRVGSMMDETGQIGMSHYDNRTGSSVGYERQNSATGVIHTGTWYRIVCAWTGEGTATTSDGGSSYANMTFYVNGVSQTGNNSSIISSGLGPSQTELTIGYIETNLDYLGGKMSDWQAWDKKWTQSDVTFDYLNPESMALNNGGTSLTESNLKIWYPMQDGHRGQQSYVLDGANTGLGDELLTNGDFSDATSTDTSVSALAGWANGGTHSGAGQRVTISNGQATMVSDGTAIRIQQTILTVGVVYRYSIDIISNDGAGGTAIRFESGAGTVIRTLDTSDTTYTGYFTADNAGIRIRRTGACNVTFDNVSIKPVNDKHHATTVFLGDELMVDSGMADASYWDVPTGWTVNDSSDGKAVLTDAANNTRLDPDDDVFAVAGRTYRAVFTIDSISEGAIFFSIGGVEGTSRNSAGTYTEDIIAANSTYMYIRASGETSGTIDNFSIKEVGTATGWTDADQQLDIPQTALQSYNQLAWFDQYDDTVIIADTTNDNDNIFDGGGSISAWIYPIDLGEGSYGRIIDKADATGGANGYYLALFSESGSTSNIKFTRGHDGTDGGWTFDARYITYGEWQHIVVVYDDDAVGNNPVIYLNGESMTLTETATPVGAEESDASNALTIGNFSGATSRTFAGCITEVSMWNKELSQAEVNELYNDGKALDATIHSASPSTGTDYLKGYWRNNGLAIWQDLTSNNNDGTPTNFTETLLLPAGVDATRDNQGFLMNRQKDTNSLNLCTNLIAGGIDDGPHAKVKHIDLGTSDFSICFWVYKLRDWTDQYIISQQVNDNNRWYIRGSNDSTSLLNIYAKSQDIDSGSDYIILSDKDTTDLEANHLDKWLHVVCTVDRSDTSNGIQWYLNGSATTNGGVNSGEGQEDASLSLAADLTIGWNEQGGQADHHFDGMIDDVLIYSDKLEATEAKRIYNAGKRSHR